MAFNKNNILSITDKTLEWSVYLAVFVVPFSKSLLEIAVSAGIIALIAKKIMTKDLGLFKIPVALPLLFIFLTAALSLINSSYLGLSVRSIFSKNLKFIFLFFLVVEAIDSRTKLENLLKMLFISAAAVFIDTFIQYFITHVDLLHIDITRKGALQGYASFQYRGPERGDRFIGYPTGPFPFPNDLASWLLIVLPIGLFLSLLDLKGLLSKFLVLFASIAGLFIFALAKVRGAWIAFVLSIVPLIFLLKRKAIVLLILVIMFMLIVACFYKTPGMLLGLSSVMDRGSMWNNGVKIFKQHPVIGNGINTFFNEYRYTRMDKDRGMGSYAHNCYLQMASDTGILGLLAFLWFVTLLLFRAIIFIMSCDNRFYYSVALGLTVGITAFLIHAFVDTNLYSLNLASLFWMAAGLTESVIHIAKNRAA